MTDKPDEITPAELRLLVKLQIIHPSRDERGKRARRAIKDQGKASQAISDGTRGYAVTYEQAAVIVYGAV